jgi:hypothetical protein
MDDAQRARVRELLELVSRTVEANPGANAPTIRTRAGVKRRGGDMGLALLLRCLLLDRDASELAAPPERHGEQDPIIVDAFSPARRAPPRTPTPRSCGPRHCGNPSRQPIGRLQLSQCPRHAHGPREREH